MSRKFKLGEVVYTPSMTLRLQQDFKFRVFVHTSLGNYALGQWGDSSAEDMDANEEALINGGIILAVYKYPADGTTILIITEWDRSATTILFSSEY